MTRLLTRRTFIHAMLAASAVAALLPAVRPMPMRCQHPESGRDPRGHSE